MTLHRLLDSSKRRQTIDGFSMIEILVAVAIIGLLATIAITQFISYRSQAVDVQMHSDLRNAAVAIEAYYTKESVLPESIDEIAGMGFHPTDGVTITLATDPPRSYTLTAVKPGGTQVSFTYDSATGKIE